MDPNRAAMAVLPFILLFALLCLAILIIPLWRIATKAGLSGPLSLLALIPGIGVLVALYVIAFMDWRVAPVIAAPYYPPYPPSQPPYMPPPSV